MMDSNSGDGVDDNSLGDSFMAGGPYMVDSGDADDPSAGDNDDEARGDNEPLREQDRFLPIANVARIMKKSIPKSGKIAKDAKECVQECVSEFISFITSDERCHQEKRKTINGEDILFAMSTLGFDSYVEPLKLYLQKYRESSKGEKGGVNSGGAGDGTLDELSEESFSHSLPANILTDQPGQQNVIFAQYPNLNPQQISFT